MKQEKQLKHTRQRLDKYGQEVAHLLEKHEYSNFLNYYLFKLIESLIEYQTLTQVGLGTEHKGYVKEEDTSKNKTDETQ